MQTLFSAVLVVILLLGAGVGSAGAVDVGDRVELVSTRSDGVPLHERSENSFRGERAPNQAYATIVATVQNGQWLQIRLNDGRVRWIVRKYVGRVVPAAKRKQSEALRPGYGVLRRGAKRSSVPEFEWMLARPRT